MFNVYRSSSAVESLAVSPETGKAIALFKNGNEYTYEGVPTAALTEVLENACISLGFWVNAYCIKAQGVSAVAQDELSYFSA